MRRRVLALGSMAAVALFSLGFDEPRAPQVDIRLDPPSSAHPFVAAAAVTPGNLQPGQTVTLIIKARTAPGWHIFAADLPTGGSIATALNLKLPKGLMAQGDWVYPRAIPNKEGEGWVYEGNLTFKRTLAVGADVPPGPLDLACEIRYQACDATTCRPPTRLSVKARAEVVAKR